MKKKTSVLGMHSHANIKKMKKKQIKINLYDEKLFVLHFKRTDIITKQILGSRKNQQDSFSHSELTGRINNDHKLAWSVVCDGMGGMASGEIASQTTAEVFKQILESTVQGDNIPMVLRQAVAISNMKVQEIAGGDMEGMSGTTVVSAVIEGNELYCASVGDSRIYISRGNEFSQITRDHNYFLELQEKVNNYEITYEEAISDPQKEALISYVGIDELKIVDINEEPILLQDGDIILLCSDGLTKVLDDIRIASYISENRNNIEDIVEVLLETVQREKPKGLDNTTISVIKYTES